MKLNPIRTLKDAGYTRLVLVRDVKSGDYYVEKELTLDIAFQRHLFENEMYVHDMLEHRYVIRFVKQTDTHKFLMEYAVNGNLEELIHSHNNEEERIKRSLQFLKGLDYLHRLGYVHNDIKPSNILLDRDNRARLADFAFAGKIGEQTFENPPDFFKLGTDFFRNPQAKRGASPYLNRIENDIYAAGVVLYLLFSGDTKRAAVNPAAIVPPALRVVVENCLKGTIRNVTEIIEAISGL